MEGDVQHQGRDLKLGGGAIPYYFLLSAEWNTEVMARAPAATLAHEGSLGLRVSHSRAKEGACVPSAWCTGLPCAAHLKTTWV